MINCRKCHKDKPQQEFVKNKAYKSGYGTICKSCKREYDKERYNNPEYKQAHLAKQKEYRKATYSPAVRREKALMLKYGLSQDDFDAIRMSQFGLCLICQEEPEKLYVDHCHKTGEVRGLLCRECNSALGMMKENTAAIFRMVDYLEGLL